MEIEAGTILAERYRVQRQLGRGGMGEVYAAENIRTGRIVAVKVLRADSKQKSSAVARFRREARAAGAINSDYVTQVLDVDDDAEHGIIIVFELLDGESLIERLKRTGPMTFEELFPIVEQVWMGLADAHKAGVIHRDLKPSNVYLERRPDGTVRVKILDFGISKLPREVGGETLTEMGQSLGTFSFMPPEQIGKAKTVDHRADIYACATLIYQALSGQLPYAARNILQMVELKTKSEPRPLAQVLDGPVDPRLERFLSRALAREPEMRFPSALESLDAWRELRRVTTGPAVAPAPAATQSRGGPMAGTALMSGQPAASSAPPPAPSGAPLPQGYGRVGASGLPTVSDTTSESSAGDQVQTVAMPLRNVAQALAQRAAAQSAGAGLPKLHDDRSNSGTQLMNHSGMRASGIQVGAPPRSQAISSGGPSSQAPISPLGGAPRFAGAAAQGGQQGSLPPLSQPLAAPQTPPPYEPNPGADLTTVYRRDAVKTVTSPRVEPPRPRGLGMLLGVVAFAVVGFAVAAVIIHYAQTGRFLWQ